jgi:hypothetical protein
MRYAISYVSTQVNELRPCEVVQILHETETRNDYLGVNGLLVYSEGNFFEVLEGEKEKIKDLYRNIIEDKRHKDIILLFQKEVHKPLFDEKDSHFISENTLYRKMEIGHFDECIEDLDLQTRNMIKNMLRVMGNVF